MSLLRVRTGPSVGDLVAYLAGLRYAEKQAADDPRPAYNLAGTLYLDPGGWLLLSVPAALVRGIFEATREPGIELPPSTTRKTLQAHVSVMSKQEVEQVGADKISERGKQFHYSLGRSRSVEPGNWPGIAKVWMVEVHSPELQTLRRSYGLSSLPHGGDYAFHITYAVRRRGVLGRTDTSKAAGVGAGSPRWMAW
jgi:hypothetical protein